MRQSSIDSNSAIEVEFASSDNKETIIKTLEAIITTRGPGGLTFRQRQDRKNKVMT